ncbi:MAG: alpha-glucan family phosphorylase, partial [Candidatus Sericytochromatia bacterium]|nr:alpha-glucan family phosphorylase [Candidatus Sericytochromatia bacterium]
GLHESLPIYSGGLGILAGDHCKAASDLGVPLIGVGLLYNHGYFRQRLNAAGQQEAIYERLDFTVAPIKAATNANGHDVIIKVELPGRQVSAKIWTVSVGRVTICLLDTDIEQNSAADRKFSSQLYGGDREMRVAQEIILGIGGVRALRAMGISPSVWHLNEGHSAFLTLELMRELVHGGLSFSEAMEAVASTCAFTTHTPVPAGNDAFSFEVMETFFSTYWPKLRLDRDSFLTLGSEEVNGQSMFSMTILALRMSRHANGVSALHGAVSRKMWESLWPSIPTAEIPIGSITNGVHVQTWVAPELATLFDEFLGARWRTHTGENPSWSKVAEIPDERLWEVHSALKAKLVEFARNRIKARRLRLGETPAMIRQADTLLDPKALTIGFARRFATYKRAKLLFRDIERLTRLVSDPDRPVQIIFAGKSHPADSAGKELIQQIVELSHQPELRGKIVFLENYDMAMARHLVQGVDIWLNNPRRPMEASGTSGQKAALNGVPNLSILDGWWCEGYDGTNGWAIGEPREYRDLDAQDDADSDSLYQLLEAVIVPSFYAGDFGSGADWQGIVKSSIISCAGLFSSQRMVEDYLQKIYRPTAETWLRFAADEFAIAKDRAAWRAKVERSWGQIWLEADSHQPTHLTVGEPLRVKARLQPGALAANELSVELIVQREDQSDEDCLKVVTMTGIGIEDGWLIYQGEIAPEVGGTFSYAVRVMPKYEALQGRAELDLVFWAVPITEKANAHRVSLRH